MELGLDGCLTANGADELRASSQAVEATIRTVAELEGGMVPPYLFAAREILKEMISLSAVPCTDEPRYSYTIDDETSAVLMSCYLIAVADPQPQYDTSSIQSILEDIDQDNR